MPIRPCATSPTRAASPRPSTIHLARLLVLACAAVFAHGASAQAARPAPPPRYDIPSGTLEDVLQAFASRSDVQLLYSPALVGGKYSSGLRGNFTSTAGLARLLAAHDLTALAVNANTYLLQSASDRARGAANPIPQPGTDDRRPVTNLAAVDVTGTRIPRTSLALSFPITVVTANDIERSGRTTLYDVLSEQPGLISHHPVSVASEGRNYPIVTAASASLYSLGPRATLYLVDGKRVAQFGLASNSLGGIVDLNSIPLSFIDRIEVLRGGASAIYGADAMAGTINIVLKKDRMGSETSFRAGISQRGDAKLRQASAILGTKTRYGGDILIAANIASQDELAGDRRDWHTIDRSRFALPDERFPLGFETWTGEHLLSLPQCQTFGEDPDSPYCRYDTARYQTLQPDLHNKSLYVRWAQGLGSSLALHFSALRSQSEQVLQFRPFVASIPMTPSHPDYPKAPEGATDAFYVLYELGAPRNHSTSVRNDVSISLEGLTQEWAWQITLSHSNNSARSAINNALVSSIARANLHRIRIDGSDNTDVMNAMRTSIYPSGYYSVDGLEFTSNRRLFDTPGGPAKIEMGASFQVTHRRSTPDPLQVSGDLSFGALNAQPYDLHARDSALFAELDLPLHRTLQTDLAIRLDHHGGFRTHASPRLGMKWTPLQSLLVRASFGEGYRAPSLHDERIPFDTFTDILFIPASPQLLPCHLVDTNRCRVTYGVGANPRLKAEYSRSLTMGIDWAPAHAFSASLDGYRILRTDEFGIADAYRYPSLFPDGLVRDSNGVLYQANRYLANIGRSETQGLEFESNYFIRDDRLGEFSFRLAAHYLSRYAISSVVQPKPIDHAGYDTPKLTVLGNATWRHGNWTTALTLRHSGRFRAYSAENTCPQSNHEANKCTNPSTSIFGINADYFSASGWSYSFAINNLLDRSPVNYGVYTGGYNIATDDILGRYFTAGATYRF